MKKGLVFFLGVLTGLLIFFIISCVIAGKNGAFGYNGIQGLTIFEEPGPQVPFKSYKVLQVVDGGALVYGTNKATASDIDYYTGTVAFLLAPSTGGYYDGQILVPPAGKKSRQKGTYQYTSGAGNRNTVPVIGFYDE